MALSAQSEPLFPAFVPARSMACSMFSVVSDAEHYRNARSEGNVSDAFGHLIADVVVVVW